MKHIKPNMQFKDNRGSIETIYTGKSWREVNRFVSEKNAIRGKHYHKETEELIFIINGKIEFEIKNLNTKKTDKIVLSNNEGILIEPYELHTAKILKKTEWISLLTKEYNKDNPDLFTMEKVN